jgi:anhydro-N-acetylmuramic acid kinase
MLAVGLMSGSSLDGIDAALVAIRPQGQGYAFEVLASRITSLDADLRERIVAALPPNEPSPRSVAMLDTQVGEAFGAAAHALAGKAEVDYVACHGLTLYHDGAARLSIQIGDPFVIREMVGATVIADFRRADCAAGGQGAPLVPYVDALLLRCEHEETIAVNIGGIANLTLIPRSAGGGEVRGWDCGPGNMLMDAFVRERTNNTENFDSDGHFARTGRIDETLLKAMLADSYFIQPPPKSTGREHFGTMFLAEHRHALDALSPEDGCATLLAVTAESIARDIDAYAARNARVVISGGGARNSALLASLRERLETHRVITASELGIDCDMKEAIAFAILGYETLRGRPAGMPGVTGARRTSVLGSIAPFELETLLGKVELEVHDA